MTDVLARFRLDGRVAVVTGASSGIGRASAQVLAGAGASVVAADIDLDGTHETAWSITDAGGTATAVRTDVSDPAAVDALVEVAVGQFGRLDVMCNIAGIIVNNDVLATEPAELDRVLDVNLKGVFYGCQAAGRVMVEQRSGSIINMASGAIDGPSPTLVSYAMSKAAVTQLTKTLASELGPSGVRVNVVAPGFIITKMTARRFTNDDGTIDEAAREATTEMFDAVTPLRRVGEPDDVAYAVLYLASEASSFMTGQILRPNGGVSMPW